MYARVGEGTIPVTTAFSPEDAPTGEKLGSKSDDQRINQYRNKWVYTLSVRFL